MKSFDLGGDGLPLHFLHANGYPPDCYKLLFEILKTQYHVFGMLLRPLWPEANMDEINDWHPFSDDLLHFLSDASTSLSANRSTAPVIGVGHSIGGIVTLRAALRDPKRFRALILFDPVLFMPSRIIAWNIARAIGIGYKIHPKISGALKRRRTFDNLDLVFRGYRTRDVFQYMSDENLRVYIEGITRPRAEGGFELAYSPEWESHIYLTSLRDMDLWRGLPKLKVPTLIIRGAETDTFLEDAASLVKRKQPVIKIETLEQSTHILPLEKPRQVADIMQSFLKENL
ncbi:MAG: alpha/beta hydrolase [Anaerolineales bacterium]|nr:alpha/beta hydrolase [Anaerolineales bacterium]